MIEGQKPNSLSEFHSFKEKVSVICLLIVLVLQLDPDKPRSQFVEESLTSTTNNVMDHVSSVQ